MIQTNTKQHTQIANMNWQDVYVTLQTSDGKVCHRSSVWIPVDKEYGQKPWVEGYHRYITDGKYCNPTNKQSK